MLYIIDSNILINAHRTHFSMQDSKNCLFWQWLVIKNPDREIKIPAKVFEEILPTDNHNPTDALGQWLVTNKNQFFLKDDTAYPALPEVANAYQQIYNELVTGDTLGAAFSEVMLEILWADPYVIAHAKVLSATVVTDERHKAGKLKNYKEIKIPYVCQKLQIPCCNFVQFLWEVRSTLPA